MRTLGIRERCAACVTLAIVALFPRLARSQSPADWPAVILEARVERATAQARSLWITAIWPDGYISGVGTLRELVQMAHRTHLLDRPRVEGGPAWIGTDLFGVSMRVSGSEIVGPDGFPREAMTQLKTLLAARFNLTLRVERRELPVYALVRARPDGTTGPLLMQSDVDCAEAVATMIRGMRPKSLCGFQQHVGRYVPTSLTMADMASVFSGFTDRPVVDRTALSGHFSATLDGVEIRPPMPFDGGYQPADVNRAMFTAMPEQLGLKLEPTTANVDVIVVDHADDPNRKTTLPLVVERVTVVPHDAETGVHAEVEVTVHNPGDRAIVAWGVSTETKFADGFVHRSSGWTDGVEYVDLSIAHSKVIPPDLRQTFSGSTWPTGRRPEGVVSTTAEPTFVIFDDNTALGDERSIRSVFGTREANHRAWPVIDRLFTDAGAQGGSPRDILVAAHAGIEAITDDSIRKSEAFRWAQWMLSVNLKTTRPDDAPLLNRMLGQIRERRAANEQHYQRR